MRFVKNQILKTPVSFLLTLLVALQPLGTAWGMAHSGERPPAAVQAEHPAGHPMTHHQHSATPDVKPTHHQDDHPNHSSDVSDQCCAAAACCPAAINAGTAKMLPARAVTAFEFHTSFQTVTPSVEIEPPRHVPSKPV